MGFAPERHRANAGQNAGRGNRRPDGKLRTGFVGTAYLCSVLTQRAYNQLAYTLFLNEELSRLAV